MWWDKSNFNLLEGKLKPREIIGWKDCTRKLQGRGTSYFLVIFYFYFYLFIIIWWHIQTTFFFYGIKRMSLKQKVIVLLFLLRVFLIQFIFVEIENWKYCSKIIFKCVNIIVRPIFNIFFGIKWLWSYE